VRDRSIRVALVNDYELAKLEAEQAERNEGIKKARLDLPWIPVEKDYEFDTEDGKKTLAEPPGERSPLAHRLRRGVNGDNDLEPYAALSDFRLRVRVGGQLLHWEQGEQSPYLAIEQGLFTVSGTRPSGWLQETTTRTRPRFGTRA
jgi:uncharacterized protein DUF899